MPLMLQPFTAFWAEGCTEGEIMNVKEFIKTLNLKICAGVPDSKLRAFCDYLMEEKGICTSHLICANEGNAVAFAAGAYMATGKVPVVYMQNSGIGNALNPILSLIDEKVYGIPCIFVVGWRGEPGIQDEPQHISQGALTIRLLEDIGVRTCIIGENTALHEVKEMMDDSQKLFAMGKSIAFIVQKNAFAHETKATYKNSYKLKREQAIECIISFSGKDAVVATTGKTGRELFEIREKHLQSHKYDFLTLGSMGHASSIALGLAVSKPDKTIWCIDGDGAALMHMGAMAVIGNRKPSNFIHIIINNEAHESVGGMPTVADTIDFPMIAKGCGYEFAKTVKDLDELNRELEYVKSAGKLSMIEIQCAIGSRSDLGRPSAAPKKNMADFMKYLGTL